MVALNAEIGKMLGSMIHNPKPFLLSPVSCPLMSRPVISVENLGKRYTIRHQANGARGGYG